jgi:hypothetical protein
MYQSYNCQQLALEAQGVSARAAALSGSQDSQRSNDQVATAAAVVIFWPAAFLVGGDKQTAAESRSDQRPNGCDRAGFNSRPGDPPPWSTKVRLVDARGHVPVMLKST